MSSIFGYSMHLHRRARDETTPNKQGTPRQRHPDSIFLSKLEIRPPQPPRRSTSLAAMNDENQRDTMPEGTGTSPTVRTQSSTGLETATLVTSDRHEPEAPSTSHTAEAKVEQITTDSSADCQKQWVAVLQNAIDRLLMDLSKELSGWTVPKENEPNVPHQTETTSRLEVLSRLLIRAEHLEKNDMHAIKAEVKSAKTKLKKVGIEFQ